MRYLLLILALVGCSEGFEVEQTTRTQVVYTCNQRFGFFKPPITLRICETREECNEFCEKIIILKAHEKQ